MDHLVRRYHHSDFVSKEPDKCLFPRLSWRALNLFVAFENHEIAFRTRTEVLTNPTRSQPLTMVNYQAIRLPMPTARQQARYDLRSQRNIYMK